MKQHRSKSAQQRITSEPVAESANSNFPLAETNLTRKHQLIIGYRKRGTGDGLSESYYPV